MNEICQTEANMKSFEPLSDRDIEALFRARDIIVQDTAVPCTGCRYCEEHCPQRIDIPGVIKDATSLLEN